MLQPHGMATCLRVQTSPSSRWIVLTPVAGMNRVNRRSVAVNESAVAPLHHLATIYFRFGNDSAAEDLYKKVRSGFQAVTSDNNGIHSRRQLRIFGLNSTFGKKV